MLRAIAPTITILGYALLIAIFVRVAFSWFNPYPNNAVYRFTYQLTEPILAPFRRLLPQTIGIDLSPMIVGFLIYIVINLISRA
ncbi:MAG TPA: YggT family protein [Candidatus Acidoferrales bacterium]|nr:YggT family protein [Candidatus Acidoferrales bacterium]